MHTVSNSELAGAGALVAITALLLYLLGRTQGHDRGYAAALSDIADSGTTALPLPACPVPVPTTLKQLYEGYPVRRTGYSAVLPNGHGNPCDCQKCEALYGPPTPR